MSISPRVLTSELRKTLFPELKRHGFLPVKPRISFRYTSDTVCILSYRCVGAYFSRITGFPPASMTVMAGLHFPCVPNPYASTRQRDKDGHPTSMEIALDLQGRIELQPRSGLSDAEAARRDVWWVEADGSNAHCVAFDIAQAANEQAMPWFERWDSLPAALDSLLAESQPNPASTWRIYCIAKELGRSDVIDEFRPLLEKQWPKHFKLVA